MEIYSHFLLLFCCIASIGFTIIESKSMSQDGKEAYGLSYYNNFRRNARLSSDLFQQLDAINKLIHITQQEGCKKIDEYCSWSQSDNMGCCHRLMCRCNLFGSNCRCEPRVG